MLKTIIRKYKYKLREKMWYLLIYNKFDYPFNTILIVLKIIIFLVLHNARLFF